MHVDARPDRCELARRGVRQYSGECGVHADGYVQSVAPTNRLGGRPRLPAEADYRRTELPGRCGDGDQLYRAGTACFHLFLPDCTILTQI